MTPEFYGDLIIAASNKDFPRAVELLDKLSIYEIDNSKESMGLINKLISIMEK